MLDTRTPDELDRFLRAAPCICVTVSEAKGSTPRVAGTRMIVAADNTMGTIGGGQLEYMAIDMARAMLDTHEQTQTLSVPLGPEIGQCCGGHVTLNLDKVTENLAHQVGVEAREALDRQPRVYIFGAGHVGRSLATTMVLLPVQCMLIDTRADELALADDAITKDLTPLPESHIRHAPPGAAFIIVTHDHALDFVLTHEALCRQDAAYVGMIGSKTKRATFGTWLQRETGRRDLLERLTMPIGASRLTDKRPAVIAAMVAAEVIQAVGTHQPTDIPA